MPVSTEDYVRITEQLAKYCWTVDEVDGVGWADLFTEDGVFAGAFPEEVTGREALRQVPQLSREQNGPMRHFITNLNCDYKDGRDTVAARYYTCVTLWENEGRFFALALARAELVRNGDSWLIKRSDNVMLPRSET